MTSFCSQCGNQVRTGGKFCQSCGATVTQSSAQSAPQSPQPESQSTGYPGAYSAGGYESSYAPQAYSPQQPQYQEPPRSGKTLKIVLISLAVLLVLLGGTVVGITLLIRRAVNNVVTVSEGSDGQKEVAINVPGGGKISASSTINEEQLGLPIYPGASQQKDGGSFSVSAGNEKGSGWFGVATFSTADAMDDVVAFYREKLGEKARLLESTNDGKRSVIFSLETEKGWRMVTIADEQEGETKIAIASVTGKTAP